MGRSTPHDHRIALHRRGGAWGAAPELASDCSMALAASGAITA
jgi:hypothetical protein